MKRSRPLGAVAAGLIVIAGLSGCSSSDDSATASTAELEARVTALENQVRGLESIIGRVIIADPASQIQQLEAQVVALEKDLADAQASATETSDALSAEVASAQAAIDDAKKAASAAKDAAGEAQAQAVIDAEARVAEAQAAIDALKASLPAVPSAAPSSVSPGTAPSAAAS